MACYVREVSSYLLCGIRVVVWLAHALRVRTSLTNSWAGVLERRGLGSLLLIPPRAQERSCTRRVTHVTCLAEGINEGRGMH